GSADVALSPADSATSALPTLSLHDALPIYDGNVWAASEGSGTVVRVDPDDADRCPDTEIPAGARPMGVAIDSEGMLWVANLGGRSEEHTSELQSRENLVCRLLLEKKKLTST